MGLPEKFNRPEKAPTTSEVGHFWPVRKDLWSLAEKSKDPWVKIQNDPNWNPITSGEWKRDAPAPETAEVKNWPYPQYAQTSDPVKTEIENTPHVNPIAGHEWPRTRSAPKEAEVANWPFPQHA